MTVNTSGPNIGRLIDADLGDSFYLELTAFLRAFDGMAQPAVIDKDLAAPPGVLVNGARYLVAANASGEWAGRSGQIARYYTSQASGSGWEFFAPRPGWQVAVLDELDANSQPVRYSYNGSTWGASAGGGGGGGMANPMTAVNDLIVGGAAGAPSRLGAPQTAGFVLTFTAQGVAWAASQGGGGDGMTNPMTTKGDLIVGAATGTPTRLAVGNAAQVLTVLSDGTLGWVTPSGGGGGSGDFKKDGTVQMTGAFEEAPFVNANVNQNNQVSLVQYPSNSIGFQSPVTIEQLVGAKKGSIRRLWFNAVCTLVNSAFLSLFTNANIVTRSGDWAEFEKMSETQDVWQMISYQRYDGTALVSNGSGDFKKDGSVRMTGAIDFADALAVNNQFSPTILELGTAASNFVIADVFGSANPSIDFLNNAPAKPGAVRVIRFVAAMTLVHNTGRISLPGAVNIAVRAGDRAEFHYLGPSTDGWECLWYTRADGTPLVSAPDNTKVSKAGDSMAGALNLAPQKILTPNAGNANTIDLSSPFASALNSDNYVIQVNASAIFGGFLSGLPGMVKNLKFNGGMTLTGSRWALPGNADILTATGDTAVVQCDADGSTWLFLSYTRANGRALIAAPDPSKLPLVGGNMTGAINEAPMVQVGSATTTNIGAVNANVIDLIYADTQNITSFGIAAAGIRRTVTRTGRSSTGQINQDSAPITLTHNADTLVLPGATNIVMVIGDSIELESLGGGKWHGLNYQRGNGQALAGTPDASKVPLTAIGAANGVAPLGSDSKIPAAYLPSYVDDVVEVATYADLPAIGEKDKIYVTDTPRTDPTTGTVNSQFRWSGSAYVPIISSPGTTTNVPEGTNLYFTTVRVLGTALAGFASAVGAVTAADTILTAIGKLQGTKVDKVTGKDLSTNDYSTTEKNKLAGIQDGAQVNAVTSVAGRTGAVTLAKGDVGLGNVDNTPDTAKPVSTAQQTALDGKAPLVNPVFTSGVTSVLSQNAFSAQAPSGNPQTGFSLVVSAGITDQKTFEWLATSQGSPRMTLRTINEAYSAGTEFLVAYRAASGHQMDRLCIKGVNMVVGQDAQIDSNYRLQVAGALLTTGPIKPAAYTLTTLPSAALFNGGLIEVTNATGGPKICRSNGSVWQILNSTNTVS